MTDTATTSTSSKITQRIHPVTGRPVAKVIVATTAMLSFISFWKAAAVVLNDMGSSAFYAGAIAEQAVGKSAPWFILGIMLFAYAVRALYMESCSMFVRGGVYRVVKEAMGETLAKISVSALMFDFILTGPISGVSAGQYLTGFLNDLLRYTHLNIALPGNFTAASFAILVTIYFWWENVKGIPESSTKALRIMYITTAMVVLMLAWCGYTLWVRGAHLPPLPSELNLHFSEPALGWLRNTRLPYIGLIGIFIGLGHSVLAMSGEETLAQVYRELEHPKIKNLKKVGFIIFAYSLIFTAGVSFFAVMIIPDGHRHEYFGNLIGGLAMNFAGPYMLRLVFQGFVVIVGTLMLAGAVNTAIVGSNGVLNRVSEDGILPQWFRAPHRRFGTSYRIINLVVILQIVTIILSRGNIFLLGEAYAFGVMWSFAMNSAAVLALRYTRPETRREFKVPFNLTIGKTEIPFGLILVTLTLLALCLINLFTKQIATIFGILFTLAFFITFTIAEKITQRSGPCDKDLDQFNVASRDELTNQTVGARPGNVLVPVSSRYALYHLGAVLDRVKTERRDIVVLHVQVLQRTGAAETELDADQLFGGVEQHLFTQALSMAESRGKPIRLTVVAANDLWDGILRAAVGLQSATIVLGRSATKSIADEAREFGLAWEALPDPRPPFNLEVFSPQGEHEFFLLGPHAPNLTRNEVNLVHQLWLRLGDLVAPAELHHHDVVHFCLNEVRQELLEGKESEVVQRLKDHLAAKKPPGEPPSSS